VSETVVDGRNMLFLLVAAIYAKSRGIHDLVIGVCETDFSGYPIGATFSSSPHGHAEPCDGLSFRGNTANAADGVDKEETWALADRWACMDYVAEHTLTCYNGVIGAGCGSCPSCVRAVAAMRRIWTVSRQG
jgi:7-cyano-7-deazaguanine synthase